jgi:hypothetical protein
MPYHYSWGESIYARVVAINIKGESTVSSDGNGAVILTNPDSPLNLRDVAIVTAKWQVGLEWDDGAENGGSALIDYKVTYGEQDGSYNLEVPGITEKSFTVEGLTTGTYYKFKVQSRNAYGLSDFSNEVIVLAAQVPDMPLAPTTSIVGDFVQIDWVQPNEQGKQIIGYQIFI